MSDHFAGLALEWLSHKLKLVLLALTTWQQTAYVQNRYIGESGRLSDILEHLEKLKVNHYLDTIDIEKA